MVMLTGKLEDKVTQLTLIFVLCIHQMFPHQDSNNNQELIEFTVTMSTTNS